MTVLVLKDIRTGEREVFRDLGQGFRIVVPPYIAHANCFAPGTVLVAGCTTAYDPDDNDSYIYRLLDEKGQEILDTA